MVSIDPACASAAAALEDDPFYRSICGAYAHDDVRRRAILEQYFAYSIQEARDVGRCVHLADRALGVAVWLLPQPLDVQSRAAHNKRAFLETAFDAEGCANYYRIVRRRQRAWLTTMPGISRLSLSLPQRRVRASAGNYWNR